MKDKSYVLARRALVVVLSAALLSLALVAGRFMSRGDAASLGYAIMDPTLAVPVHAPKQTELSSWESKTPTPSAAGDLSPSSSSASSAKEEMLVPPIAIYQGQPDNGNWLWPAQSSIITSPFGFRSDPFTGEKSFHSGLDIAAGCGAEIWAARSGTVIFAGVAGGYGNRVVIDHGNGVTSAYAHLMAMHVKAGDQVQQRQTIGQSGSTGRSTGCHLHFEIIVGGAFADPLPFLGGPSSASLLPPLKSASPNPGQPTSAPTYCAVQVNADAAADSGGSVPISYAENCIPMPIPVITAEPQTTNASTPEASPSASPAASSSVEPALQPSAAEPMPGTALAPQPAVTAMEQPTPPALQPMSAASSATATPSETPTPTPTPTSTPGG